MKRKPTYYQKSKYVTPTFFLLAIVCLLGGCEHIQHVESPMKSSTGRVERLPDFSETFIPNRPIDVWLPDGYDSSKSFAVLYMHDGQMLFDDTQSWNGQEWKVDEVLGELMAGGKVKEVIVVGIGNAGKNRHAEYFPQAPFESLEASYKDSLLDDSNQQSLFATAVYSDAYLSFLVEELKPYIDAYYATKPDRQNTYVAGSSMGGLISMYAMCEYPDVFSGAACLSTHWVGIFEAENNPIPDAFVSYLGERLPDPSQHKWYFDYGTETLDAMYEPYQLRVDSTMKEKGYSPENWRTLKFEGQNHSEDAWSQRLHIPITFLLAKE
ncbi:MAG: alpha/beta hydrolase-fold protein [Bacteroidota bacterium]